MLKSNYDSLFYVEHLGESSDHAKLIESFEPADPRGKNVVAYLKHNSMRDEINGTARTYLVRDNETDELVGFFTLCAGKVIQHERKSIFRRLRVIATPGIEIMNFAVNKAYKNAHPLMKNIGTDIFVSFIFPIAQSTQNAIGARILYLYALPFPSLLHYYSTLGFILTTKHDSSVIYRHCKPTYDEHCKFMFMPL